MIKRKSTKFKLTKKKMTKYLRFILFVFIVFGISCSGNRNKSNKVSEEKDIKKEEVPHNKLSDSEIEKGWMLLFDGKTSQGWRGYNKDHFPPGWKVVDGTFFCKGLDGGEAGAVDGGDIIYDNKEFSNN